MAKMHGWLLGQDATCQNAGDPLQICRAIFCTRADTPRARPDRNGGRRIRHAAASGQPPCGHVASPETISHTFWILSHSF